MGEGCQKVGTREMGDLIASAVEAGDICYRLGCADNLKD